MRKLLYLPALFAGLTALTSCEKDPEEIPFDDVFSKPYTTGVIKFQHRVITSFKGRPRIKDTTVIFTSIGNNPAQKDDYGYFKPSIPWTQLVRLNPGDFQNKAMVLFVDVNLDSLTFPHKFPAGDTRNGQLIFQTGAGSFFDEYGKLVHGNNEYGAGTFWEEFEMTILSKTNNRVQGTFHGFVRNHDGLMMKIDKGLFDVEIVKK